jgi:creatinine amidohydrolase
VTVYRLHELHPRDLEDRLAVMPALVLPLGTIEWHGHHLPLGLDGLKAEAVAARVAEQTGAVLAPTAWWAADGVPFPFTLRLEAGVVERVLGDALVQFAGMGFAAICIVNGHYGLANSRAVRAAALRCMEATDATALPIADYEALTDIGHRGDHAGVWETSLLWAAHPALIRLDAVSPEEPLEGVIGEDPRATASLELGRRATGHAAERIGVALRRAVDEDAGARETYRAALAAGQAALDALAALRGRLPRADVPPVLTASWAEHLEALLDGRYEDAHAGAERKFVDPAS